MNPSFRIWLKSQAVYALLLFATSVVLFFTEGLFNNIGEAITFLITVATVAFVVEAIFSIPAIFLFAVFLSILKSVRLNPQESIIVSAIGLCLCFYACALFMILLFCQHEFLSIAKEPIFNMFTGGVLVAALVSIYLHKKDLTEYLIEQEDTNNNLLNQNINSYE